ncbi:MAG: hypothetical protein AB7T38_16935 [Nitrospirales bacterium]
MKEAMETSDVVVAALAAMGVVVLVVVFVYVVKRTFFSDDKGRE